MDVAALRSHCQVSDLAATILDAKQKNIDNDRLRRDLEANRRAAVAGSSMISNPGGAQAGASRPQ